MHATPTKDLKLVRFAYKNDFYSPIGTPVLLPRATLPVTSVITSTPALSHPVITSPSPYNTLPVTTPPPYPPRTRPHPYLDTSGISWDMTEHPSTISRRHQSLSRRIWKEGATYPPLPRITIIIPNFPWIIYVRATTTSCVTLEDVVDTIYASLRETLTRSDLYAVGSKLAPTDQYYVARAYEHRYGNQRSEEFYNDEKRRSLRRVDFLVGRTRFMGLVNNPRKSDQWQLNTK